MKNTLYLSILAAALMGGQVFAAVIPTTTDANEEGNRFYVGEYSQTADVSGANVTINEEPEGGDDFSGSRVYGGYTGGEQTTASNNSVTMTGGQVANVVGGYSSSGDASDNKITMTGGQVKNLYGGEGNTTASRNTVIMTGGKLTSSLRGGHSTAEETPLVEKNVVIVAGNSEITGNLYGGYSSHGYAKDNKVYLVGKGATATITDAQGITKTYDGGNITLKAVYAGQGDSSLDNNSIDNSIDIYGTGITASSYVEDMQVLNFHI